MKLDALTRSSLVELLLYDAETGEFFWKAARNGTKGAGAIAGNVGRDGYRRIRVNGKAYLAHRLALLHETGKFPVDEVDHVNHRRDDNRISNLRGCSSSENSRNMSLGEKNSSGVIGVYFEITRGKWRGQIRDKGKVIHLGYYRAFLDAVCARKSAELKFAYHANHGV